MISLRRYWDKAVHSNIKETVRISQTYARKLKLTHEYLISGWLALLCISSLYIMSLVVSNEVKACCSPSETAARMSTNTPPSDYYQSFLAYGGDKVALKNVTLLDGKGSAPKSHQTIFIDNGVIVEVGDSSGREKLENYQYLDLNGHTVIPGLIGTHNHMRLPQGALLHTSPKMYLASGVTTIQTCGTGHPEEELAIKKNISQQLQPGPDIVASSPYFTGPDGRGNFISFTSEAEVRETISFWANKGIEWFKVYMHTRPQDLAIIVDEAHKHGAKVTGHLCATTFIEAANAGIDAIEHGFIHSYDHAHGHVQAQCSGSRDFRSSIDINSDEVNHIQQTLIANNVAISATPAIFEAQTVRGGVADERTLKALSPFHKNDYHQRRERMTERKESWYFKEDWLPRSLEYELAFFRKGGLLTAGPDPGLHNLPGFGDQRNYELFVEAGFKPREAIQVMTSNGARLLGKDDVGSIEAGKKANLVVLEGNLVEDASVIREVAYVVKEGDIFNPKALLEGIEGHVGSSNDDSLKYFGSRTPGAKPELLAKNLITKPDEHEFGSVFSESGEEFFFGVDLGERTEIRTSKLTAGVWSEPGAVISHPIYSFNDPFLSVNGSVLYYISDMPLEKVGPPKDYDIWYSTRENGKWSPPIHAGDVINSSHDEYFVSSTTDGTFYFASNKAPQSSFDIYSSQLVNGQFTPPVKLPESINTQAYEADVFIAPDESYMIFSSVRKQGLGKGDLYISFQLDDGAWSEAQSLGLDVNTEGHELCPFVTADGKHLLFTRNGDLYWMDAAIIENAR
ncbi:MAG: amidohydrolase family protein [Alteromonadaceae bacterium]|nr:amidohydrolase family protein [Alteromonadaceae bacterium]